MGEFGDYQAPPRAAASYTGMQHMELVAACIVSFLFIFTQNKMIALAAKDAPRAKNVIITLKLKGL